MASPEQIRISLERKAQEIALRPSVGQGTATTRVTLKPGLECDIEEGTWKLTVGMAEKMGGKQCRP